MFLSQSDVNLIYADFERNLRSSEASLVTLRWRTLLAPEGPPVKDEVYGIDDQNQEADEQTKENVRTLQQIVGPKDYKLLQTGIVQTGEAIFYFSATLNMGEPNEGAPVVPGSLLIQTADGEVWQPKLRESAAIQRHLACRIGNKQISQAVVCEIYKGSN